MATINKLILLTVLCNSFIIVGIGHGGGPLGLVQFMFINELLSGDLVFNMTGGYSERLPGVAITTLGGQLLMFISCFPNRPAKTYLTFAGLGMMLFSFILLIVDFPTASLDSFSLMFGIPFLYASIRLLLYFWKTKNQLGEEQQQLT